MKKYLTHALVSICCFGATALVAEGASFYQNPITYGGITTVPQLLLALVDLVFLIGVPIIVIFIIYGGFIFVKSGDNESELAKAKTIFMWTLVGALVLLGAKAISLAIQGTIDTLR